MDEDKSPCETCPRRSDCHAYRSCTRWTAWFWARWERMQNLFRRYKDEK